MHMLEELRHELQRRVQGQSCREVTLAITEHRGVPRLDALSAHEDESRYLQVNALEAPSRPWDFTVLLGAFGGDPARALDGRCGGDLDYVGRVFDAWILKSRDWSQLPEFD